MGNPQDTLGKKCFCKQRAAVDHVIWSSHSTTGQCPSTSSTSLIGLSSNSSNSTEITILDANEFPQPHSAHEFTIVGVAFAACVIAGLASVAAMKLWARHDNAMQQGLLA